MVPHSGRHYAPEFLAQSVLDSHAIRASEDAFVDHLFEPAVQFGAPLLVANAPRAYVDLNRACDELDPAVIEVPVLEYHALLLPVLIIPTPGATTSGF